MERRKVSKGIAAATGVNSARPRMFAYAQDQGAVEKPSLALPIRGLANKNGRLVQPIKLTIEHAGADTTLVARVDRQQVDSRNLTAGTHTVNVYFDPVQRARFMLVEYMSLCGADSA